MNVSYVITDDSLVLRTRPTPLTVGEDHPNFAAACALLTPLRGRPIRQQQLLVALQKLLSLKSALEYFEGGGYKIDVRGQVSFHGEPLPVPLSNRLSTLFRAGKTGWVAMANFWARLARNPSRQSVSQLGLFMEHGGLPIGPRGYLYAYKAVRADYRDAWSGTFDNRPPAHLYMDRKNVSDNSNKPCDHGFHVGTYQFAKNYGGLSQQLLIVRVDPADVVRVPSATTEKMGVCQYWAIGHATTKPMPNTFWTPEEGAYCQGYVEAEYAYYHYDVVLTKIGTDRLKVINGLVAHIGVSIPVAQAIVDNLPATIATSVESQVAKKLISNLGGLETPEGTHFSIEGIPTEAIDPLGGVLGAVQEPATAAPKPAPAPAQPPKPATAEKPAPKVQKAGSKPLSEMTRNELRIRCRELGLTGYGKLGVGALCEKIRVHQGENKAKPAEAEKKSGLGAGKLIEDAARAKELIAPVELEEHAAQARKVKGLDQMGRDDLRAYARDIGLKKYGKMGAGALREAIVAAQATVAPPKKAQKPPGDATQEFQAEKAVETKLKGKAEKVGADYSDTSRADLRVLAGKFGVPGTSKLGATALRALLGAADRGIDMQQLHFPAKKGWDRTMAIMSRLRELGFRT